jgi:hypothetical protein
MPESTLRRLTFHALLAGLCPLIPIPFLDDRVLAWVHRRRVREQLERHGFERLGSDFQRREAVAELARRESKGLLAGCFRLVVIGPLIKLIVRLISKVFRKIVLILTLKDCVDRFSEAFHEGFLLERALEGGRVEAHHLDAGVAGVLWLRWAIRTTCEAVDPRPLNQLVKRTLKGSRVLLLRASRTLGKLFRKGRRDGEVAEAVEARLEQREEALLGSLLDRLTAAIQGEAGYLAAVGETFQGNLELTRPRPPAPEDS